jgi:hypothetical protein
MTARIIKSQIKDPKKRKIAESIITPDVATAIGSNRFMFKRFKRKKKDHKIIEDNFNDAIDFVFNFPMDEIDDIELLNDIVELWTMIDFIGRTSNDNYVEMSDAELFEIKQAKRSKNRQKAYARRYWRKKGKHELAKRKRTAKHKLNQAKKKRLENRNSRLTPVKGKQKVRYNTKGHVNSDLEILKNGLQILLLEIKGD